MKRSTIPVLGAALLAVILACGGCKKAEVETGTLTVIVSQGVTGTPGAGTYTVTVGDTWAYTYSLEAGYSKLTVLVDGTEVAASGTLVITGSHTIQAYSDDNLQYTLIVTWGSGVTGTPAAGTYLYKQGAKVPYSFALAEGYTALNVTLDGTAAEASGTLTMSKDYALYAGAQVKYDVRGPWKLTESYDDGSSFEVTATFSGTMSGGTVTDSAGGAGTYEFVDATVDFTLAFPDVTYKYSNGSFTDANTMSGSCQRYQDVNNAISGTWSATRASAAVPGTSSRAKGQFRRR